MKINDYVDAIDKYNFIKDYIGNDKRLMRLFMVACCYQIWDLIKDEQSQKAVEIAELYADGLVTEEERQKAYRNTITPLYPFSIDDPKVSVSNTSSPYVHEASYSSIANAYVRHIFNINLNAEEAMLARLEIYRKQALILKNMKGNWHNSWNTSDVTSLAKTIYDNKLYTLMPILSDALQEAGCQDEEILDYCCNGFHYRGCWVLDKATEKR